MVTTNIGKTKINFEVEGCTCCGTRWSRGWVVIKVVAVQIGSRKFEIQIHACANCADQNTQPQLL